MIYVKVSNHMPQFTWVYVRVKCMRDLTHMNTLCLTQNIKGFASLIIQLWSK